MYAYVGGDPVNLTDPMGLHGPRPGQSSGIPVNYCHQIGHNTQRPGQTHELEISKGTWGVGDLSFTCCRDGKVVNVFVNKICRGVFLSGASFEPPNAGITSKNCDGLKKGESYFGVEVAGDFFLGIDGGLSFPSSGPSGTISIEFAAPGGKIGACTYIVNDIVETGDCCGQ